VSDSASVIAALQPHVAEIQRKKPKGWNGSMAIETLRSLYAEDILTPETIIKEVYKRLALPDADLAVWLHVIPERTSIQLAQDLLKKYPVPSARPPLFGIPFSIKDSIDIKGLPTTGACPAYAYTAEKDAPSFVSLIEAGAIPIGKVNLVGSHLSISKIPLSDDTGPRINLPPELWVCVRHTGNLLLYSQKITSLEVPAQVPALAWPASKFLSRWQRILQVQDGYQLRSITSLDLNRLEEQYVELG
jgi:hypothetical protein